MYRTPAERSVALNWALAHLIKIIHYGVVADMANKTNEQHRYFVHWNSAIESIQKAKNSEREGN
jgi:hypothetical protein